MNVSETNVDRDTVLATQIPRMMSLTVRCFSEIVTTAGKVLKQTQYDLHFL